MSGFQKGDSVMTPDKGKGVVTDAENPHDIMVEYEGGQGMYCTVRGCHMYEELRKVKDKEK